MIRKSKKIFRNLLTRYRYGNRFEGVIFTKRNENISRKGIIEIRDYTTIANAHLLAWNLIDTIKIGKFCSIASGVKILGGGNHKIHRVTSYLLKHVLLYNMTRRTKPFWRCRPIYKNF
jgi:acetyltransferase-like isoleucine patch superfamily enzyme